MMGSTKAVVEPKPLAEILAERKPAAPAVAAPAPAAYNPNVISSVQWEDFKRKEKASTGWKMPNARLLKPDTLEEAQSQAGYLGSLHGAKPIAASAPVAAAPVAAAPAAAGDYLSNLMSA